MTEARRRRLAFTLLALAVLAVHLWVIGGLPLGGGSAGPAAPHTFQTRLVPPTPAPAVAVAVAPAPRPAAPSPRPRPRPTPAAPVALPPPAPPEAVAVAPEPEPAPAPVAEAPAAKPPAAPASDAVAIAPVEAASSPATPAAEPFGVEIRTPGGAVLTDATPAVRLPAPARLAFEVGGQAKKFNYSASAELVWRHDGARYEARQQIKAFLLGTRSQTSTGVVTATGLQPERFGDKSRSEQAAHFNFAEGTVIFSANTPRASIGPGAQDRLSVFIQLGALLAAAPAQYPDGTHITLTTVGARYADRWTFTIEGEELLDLPAGTVPAIKLQRLPRRDYDQRAELWLAPDLGYLPARIRLTQSNGDFADLRLSEQSAP